MANPLIYLVEDDPLFVNIIEGQLSKLKLTNFKTFTRGEDCLAEIKNHPQYLFVDFSLEGLNGLDILREAKKTSKHTRVYMLTALEDKTIEQQCLKEGAIDYIVKNEEGLAKFKKILKKASKGSRKNLVILLILIGILIGFLLSKLII